MTQSSFRVKVVKSYVGAIDVLCNEVFFLITLKHLE